MWGPATGLEVVTGSQGPTCSADAYALFAFRTCSSLRDAQAVISETVVDVCRIGATLLIRHFFFGGGYSPSFWGARNNTRICSVESRFTSRTHDSPGGANCTRMGDQHVGTRSNSCNFSLICGFTPSAWMNRPLYTVSQLKWRQNSHPFTI